MEYKDEKILDFINEVEKIKTSEKNFEEPVEVGDKYYEFEKQSFFDEKLQLYIPKDFDDMPKNQRELKYPSSQRPQIIKSDDTGSVNITLSKIDNNLTEDSVEELTLGMMQIIKRTNPANIFYGSGVKKVESKNIGYFEFKSYALDDNIYNAMFYFQLEGKTIMVTCSCLYNEYKEWKNVFFKIIETLQVADSESKVWY